MAGTKWQWQTIEDGRDTVGAPRLKRVRVFSCKVGECPWDDWYLAARAAGIDTELALLGSAVMREADRRGWSEELQAECGWGDDGAAMLAFALREPERARLRWQHLLEHDVAASVK